MIKTTKEQRAALLRKAKQSGEDYRALRRRIQETFFMDSAIVVEWCGMWLCIETDGYTHS